jgi:hypothetical protein
MDVRQSLPLRLAHAEAELVELESERAETEAKLIELKKKIPGFQKLYVFLTIPNITIILIPIFVPLMILFALLRGLPLASARGTAERRAADLLKAINAKRSEVARLKVQLASAA